MIELVDSPQEIVSSAIKCNKEWLENIYHSIIYWRSKSSSEQLPYLVLILCTLFHQSLAWECIWKHINGRTKLPQLFCHFWKEVRSDKWSEYNRNQGLQLERRNYLFIPKAYSVNVFVSCVFPFVIVTAFLIYCSILRRYSNW